MSLTSLSTQINALIDQWPEDNAGALADQLRRSIVQTRERLQFMFYADGSIQEAKSQVTQAGERGLLNADDSLYLFE